MSNSGLSLDGGFAQLLLSFFPSEGCASVGVMISCRDGLVLVSDKRVCTVKPNGEVISTKDDFCKLRSLNSHCMYGVFGQPTDSWTDNRGQIFHLDFYELIETYFGHKNDQPTLSQSVSSDFANFLGVKCREYLLHKPKELWIGPWCDDGKLCTITIADYNKVDKKVEFLYLRVVPKPTTNEVGIEGQFAPNTFSEKRKCGCVTAGKVKLRDEILRSKSGNFKCRRFLGDDRPPLKTVSKRDATDAALEFARLTHERNRVYVGETVDVYVLNASGVKPLPGPVNVYHCEPFLRSLATAQPLK